MTAAPYPFVAKLGAFDSATKKLKVGVFSLTDAIATVTVGGVPKTVQTLDWKPIGDTGLHDSQTYAQACFYCWLEFDLEYFTQYIWSASQIGQSITWPVNDRADPDFNKFRTSVQPGSRTRHSVWLWTCDGFNRGNDAILDKILETRNDGFPCVGIIKQDDLVYADSVSGDVDNASLLDDRVDVSFSQRFFTTPANDPPGQWINKSEHDYAVSFMSYYGMIGVRFPGGTARSALWGNLPVYAGDGDHEKAYNYRKSPNQSNIVYDSATYHASEPVWRAFYDEGNPAPLSVGTYKINGAEGDQRDVNGSLEITYNDRYFGQTSGIFSWTQDDPNSYACADATYAADSEAITTVAMPVQRIGLQQTNDLMDYLSGSGSQFTMFCSSNAPFSLTSTFGLGGQEPWRDTPGWTADYDEFENYWSQDTALNGDDGKTFFYYFGNDHNSHDISFTAPNGKPLRVINAGPITHGGNHPVGPEGSTFNGADIEWNNGALPQSGNVPVQSVTRKQGAVRVLIDSDPSNAQDKLIYQFYDEFGQIERQLQTFGNNIFTEVPTVTTTLEFGNVNRGITGASDGAIRENIPSTDILTADLSTASGSVEPRIYTAVLGDVIKGIGCSIRVGGTGGNETSGPVFAFPACYQLIGGLLDVGSPLIASRAAFRPPDSTDLLDDLDAYRLYDTGDLDFTSSFTITGPDVGKQYVACLGSDGGNVQSADDAAAGLGNYTGVATSVDMVAQALPATVTTVNTAVLDADIRLWLVVERQVTGSPTLGIPYTTIVLDRGTSGSIDFAPNWTGADTFSIKQLPPWMTQVGDTGTVNYTNVKWGGKNSSNSIGGGAWNIQIQAIDSTGLLTTETSIWLYAKP